MTALSPRIGGEKEFRMSKKGRRSYSVEEKVSVLREHLVEGKAVSEVCERCPASVGNGQPG
jgi:hypothetical protein